MLLLVHGVGSSSRTWDDVVDLLAEQGAHVVVLDLPGHGASDKSRGDYSLGAFANTIRDLLDHLGLDRVVFVGHSLGGGIGMQFAYQYPAALRRARARRKWRDSGRTRPYCCGLPPCRVPRS